MRALEIHALTIHHPMKGGVTRQAVGRRPTLQRASPNSKVTRRGWNEKLDAEPKNLTVLCLRQRFDELWDKRAQIRQAVAGSAKNDDRNSKPGQVLLKG